MGSWCPWGSWLSSSTGKETRPRTIVGESSVACSIFLDRAHYRSRRVEAYVGAKRSAPLTEKKALRRGKLHPRVYPEPVPIPLNWLGRKLAYHERLIALVTSDASPSVERSLRRAPANRTEHAEHPSLGENHTCSGHRTGNRHPIVRLACGSDEAYPASRRCPDPLLSFFRRRGSPRERSRRGSRATSEGVSRWRRRLRSRSLGRPR